MKQDALNVDFMQMTATTFINDQTNSFYWRLVFIY